MPPADYAMRATGALISAVALGIAVYIGFTFATAYAHVPKRGLFHTFHYAFRESMLAAFVTALFPLYVAIGRKRGKGTRPVVLVHGYTQNRADFVYISRFLRSRGIGPVYGFNYFSFADIRSSGKRLARFVEHACKETGAEAVESRVSFDGGSRRSPLHPARARARASLRDGRESPLGHTLSWAGGRARSASASYRNALHDGAVGRAARRAHAQHLLDA